MIYLCIYHEKPAFFVDCFHLFDWCGVYTGLKCELFTLVIMLTLTLCVVQRARM